MWPFRRTWLLGTSILFLTISVLAASSRPEGQNSTLGEKVLDSFTRRTVEGKVSVGKDPTILAITDRLEELANECVHGLDDPCIISQQEQLLKEWLSHIGATTTKALFDELLFSQPMDINVICSNFDHSLATFLRTDLALPPITLKRIQILISALRELFFTDLVALNSLGSCLQVLEPAAKEQLSETALRLIPARLNLWLHPGCSDDERAYEGAHESLISVSNELLQAAMHNDGALPDREKVPAAFAPIKLVLKFFLLINHHIIRFAGMQDLLKCSMRYAVISKQVTLTTSDAKAPLAGLQKRTGELSASLSQLLASAATIKSLTVDDEQAMNATLAVASRALGYLEGTVATIACGQEIQAKRKELYSCNTSQSSYFDEISLKALRVSLEAFRTQFDPQVNSLNSRINAIASQYMVALPRGIAAMEGRLIRNMFNMAQTWQTEISLKREDVDAVELTGRGSIHLPKPTLHFLIMDQSSPHQACFLIRNPTLGPKPLDYHRMWQQHGRTFLFAGHNWLILDCPAVRCIISFRMRENDFLIAASQSYGVGSSFWKF